MILGPRGAGYRKTVCSATECAMPSVFLLVFPHVECFEDIRETVETATAPFLIGETHIPRYRFCESKFLLCLLYLVAKLARNFADQAKEVGGTHTTHPVRSIGSFRALRSALAWVSLCGCGLMEHAENSKRIIRVG